MKKFFRDLVPLVGICLVAALLLAVFNMITEGPIAENALRAALETRTRLLSSAASFEQVELEEGSAMDSCYEGFDVNGESVGYVVETTVGGYAGPIVVTVGLNADNVITGINVGGDNFSETAGLGAKAKEASFTDQFIGESAPLSLAKGTSGPQDGVIDAISGATITSTAVNGGVNSAAKFIMDMSGEGASPNTASVQGFAGPVAVTLSLDDAGAITEITIGDAFFNETPGYGAGALEEAFHAQFIGKVPPLTLADIDAISGATITSNAVVNAVNQVQAQLSGAAPVAAPAEEIAPVPAAGENAKTGSAQGFAGPVAVAFDLDDSGAITAITIGDENFAETAGFGAKAQDDAFKTQFIGKTLPIIFEDIDAIAGATITSKAVVEALNAAGGFAPEATAEEAAPVPAAGENAKTASAQGFAGPVTVAVDLEDGVITAITIGDENFAETAGFGAKAQEDAFKAQFIGKTLPIDSIDAIAGATVTSNAVAEALNAIVTLANTPVEEAVPAAAITPVEGEVFTGSAQGFAGPVAVEVTVADGAIASIKIGDDQFAETAGFGAKALEEDFQKQFIGKALPVAIEDIDAIAGATITSKAVIEAINSAAVVADEAETVETPAIEAVLAGSAQGFAGPVAVTVTVDADNTIIAITIGDENFAETKGLGSNVQRDSHTSKFIGKKLPLAEGDIDAVSGATITSNAVMAAVNAAQPMVAEETSEKVLKGSAKGFAGPVAVEVTVDAANEITAITIGDDQFAETAGFGAKAQEEAFLNQFIGKTLPVAIEDIDAIAGATITTTAVIEALAAAE